MQSIALVAIMLITFAYVLIAVYLFIYLYACYSRNKKSIKRNRMKFGGMIVYYPGTVCLDFGIDRVKGQGHEKVKIFLP